MKMDKWFFRAAGAFVVLVLFAHELIGSPMVLPPLQSAAIPENVIWLHNFSWHVGSIAMLAMVCLFVAGAREADDIVMVSIATGMSIGFAVLGIGLAIFESDSLWGTPAPYAWSIVSIVGVSGIGIRLKSRAV